MLDQLGEPLVLIAVGSAAVAAALYAASLRLAKQRAGRPGPAPSKDATDVLSAVATALVAGGVLSVAVFALQERVAEQRDRETRLLMTADLSGYDPGPGVADRGRFDAEQRRCVEPGDVVADRRFLRARYLASRRLAGARLGGLNLDGTEFRDSDLRGVILTCSRLRGANLRHTDLQGADLRGADLRGTDLRGTSLRMALLPAPGKAWQDAQVNAQTCWPRGVSTAWVRSLPVRPWDMRGATQLPESYGHLCGHRAAILVEPGPERTAPAAPGEPRPGRARSAGLEPEQAAALTEAVRSGVSLALEEGNAGDGG